MNFEELDYMSPRERASLELQEIQGMMAKLEPGVFSPYPDKDPKIQEIEERQFRALQDLENILKEKVDISQGYEVFR